MSQTLNLTGIAEQYQYDQKLVDMLKHIVPALIDYYQDPQLVERVLCEYPVHIQRYEDEGKEGANVPREKLGPIISSYLLQEPKIAPDGTTVIEKGIYIRDFAEDSTDLETRIGDLVATLVGAIGATSSPAEINNDVVTIHNGLSTEKYQKVFVKLDEKMNGAEALISALEAHDVVSKIIQDPEKQLGRFGNLRYVAEQLPKEIIEALKFDRRHGTQKIRDILPPNLIDIFMTQLDDLVDYYNVDYAKIQEAGGPEAYNQNLKEMADDLVKFANECVSRPHTNNI